MVLLYSNREGTLLFIGNCVCACNFSDKSTHLLMMQIWRIVFDRELTLLHPLQYFNATVYLFDIFIQTNNILPLLQIKYAHSFLTTGMIDGVKHKKQCLWHINSRFAHICAELLWGDTNMCFQFLSFCNIKFAGKVLSKLYSTFWLRIIYEDKYLFVFAIPQMWIGTSYHTFGENEAFVKPMYYATSNSVAKGRNIILTALRAAGIYTALARHFQKLEHYNSDKNNNDEISDHYKSHAKYHDISLYMNLYSALHL